MAHPPRHGREPGEGLGRGEISRDVSRLFKSRLSSRGSGFGLFAGLGLGTAGFARGLGGILQTIDVSEAAAALLNFIVLFTHKMSPPL